MVSEIQLRANRENAKFGGVKTAVGKAVSSRNAIARGILSKEVLLSGEDFGELNKLRRELIADREPQGAVEALLVEIIAISVWRWRRILIVETEKLDLDSAKEGNYSLSSIGYLQNIMRYEATMERRMYRALNEIERVQGIRKGEKVPPRLSINKDR